MRTRFTPLREEIPLTPRSIDEISLRISEALGQIRIDRRDCIRFRFASETILCTWMEALGEGTLCTVALVRRFGRIQLTLTAIGAAVPPDAKENAFFEGLVTKFSLLQHLGLAGGYTYEDGKNTVSLTAPRPGPGLWPLLFSLGLAIALGLLFSQYFPSFSNSLSSTLLTPLFDTLMHLITAVEGPMVFLAVATGICGMGDLPSMERVGKRVLSRFTLLPFLLAGLFAVPACFLLPLASHSQWGEGALKSILELILGAIPADIVSPFQNHNALQVIVLAVLCGIGLLLLGRSVPIIHDFLDQLHALVQTLMGLVCRLIPLLVFLCILDIYLQDSVDELRDALPALLVVAGMLFLLALLYPAIAALHLRRPLLPLLRAIAPATLIALSTASSVAATHTMVESCEHTLHIDRHLAALSLHLGEVIFKLGSVVEYFVLTLGIAYCLDIPMTIGWILTAAILSGVLSIASPPEFGAGAVVYGILFAQLGIPEEGVALAIVFSFLLGYCTTAANVCTLQTEVLLDAHALNMLDKKETERV